MSETSIVRGYLPGSLGRIVEMHGAFYHRHAGLGLFFEATVARQLAEFLGRYDPERDAVWLVVANGRVEGSIVIDGLSAHSAGARLRWFFVSEQFRGTGLGKVLLGTALDFCREKRYERVYLWTVGGLAASRHLYEKSGFELTHQATHDDWGSMLNEQRFELHIPVPREQSVQTRRRGAHVITEVARRAAAEYSLLLAFLLGALSVAASFGVWIWRPLFHF